MKADLLKSAQAKLKEKYAATPDTAIQNLTAVGTVDFDNLACNITQPSKLNPGGLHPSSGGDGTFACPVEIMLAGWVSCAGVTFAAVRHAMKLNVDTCEITATGTIDFRGTLAVDREAPVGLTALKLTFKIESDEPKDKIEKLVQLTERYCVVHQTLCETPSVESEIT